MTVELVNCACERYPLDAFSVASFAPHRNALGEFRLRYCEGDIPAEFLTCCSTIEVTLDWQEVGISAETIFTGVFTSFTGYVNRESDVLEWRGTQLTDKLRDTVIAYRSGTAGATKTGLTAIEAAYEFLAENLVTPLPDRGDGTACAIASSDCVEVVPPTAAQIANSMAWSGSRSYDNLFETVVKIANNNDFGIEITQRDDCCYVIEFTEFREIDIDLSECLENLTIYQIGTNCRRYDRVHVLGAGEDGDRAVVSVCDADIETACCVRETTLERNQESDPTALLIEGEEFLASQEASERILFETSWGCSFIPWRDIRLGDIVRIEGEQYKVDQLPFEIAFSDTGAKLTSVQPIFEAI